MPANEERLIEDHQKVIQTIRKYTNIFLVNTSGDPPDEYDIEYKVRGYALTTDGKVVTRKHHRIKIKIPFGYPHFPPTIKPLSPIFHPEVDDYVMPIANYWEENKSLPDLIIHIGNMLCGAVYKTDSAFNEKAAEYYQKHRKELPLDSLQLVKKSKRRAGRSISFGFLIPVFKSLFFLLFLAIIGVGGLFFYEKLKIQQAGAVLTKAEIYEVDKDFEKAQQTAQKALKSLDNFYLLEHSQTAMQKEIEDFLQSESLLQGLQGNIRYGNKYVSITDVQKINFFKDLVADAEISMNKDAHAQAIQTFEKALDYATSNSLDVDTGEIRNTLVHLKFQVLQKEAEEAHENKNWEEAVSRHQQILEFIENNRENLKDTKKQEDSFKHMLLVAQIAHHSQEAVNSEKAGEFALALQHHQTLVDLIGNSESGDSATMKNTLADSVQQVATLQEKLRLQKQRLWLLKNYKEIFKIHYPTVLSSSLQNPQALFLKYDGINSVFDLSCLEKGAGTVVRLRVYYQFNPETGEWSIYDEKA
ncbi:MAG: ubiquitin-conjugating enzyme E2 [Desulfocapsaceae bacterium]|nr:ubiquitin-conjugating enzyme E2 [Desulfocapsaceae bacterium]